MMRSILHKCFILMMIVWQVPVWGQVSTANITGRDDRVCPGDSVAADLNMTGSGPWTLVINDNQGEYLVIENVTSPHTIWLKPEVDDSYTIASVVDRNDNEGLTLGQVDISVLPFTPVEIILDRITYLKSETGIPLASNPAGASFFGKGVVGTTFYPAEATPVGSPHGITCSYTNAFGCPSTDSVDIHVIHGESSVVLVSEGDTINTLCDDLAGYEIRGSNLDSIQGTFAIKEITFPGNLPGYIEDEDPNDNKAILNPAGLSGAYDLIYSYEFDVLTVTSTQRIYANDLAGLEIGGLPEIVCDEDDPYLLFPVNIENDPGATYLISGKGVTGNQILGYYFNPRLVDAGPVTLTLEYTSSNGCSFGVDKEIMNGFTPEVSFTFTPACVSPSGGTVSFTNTTSGKFAVETWEWNFGDPESGPQNNSSEENPTHRYDSPGWKQMRLKATTVDGCEVISAMDTMLIDQPEADFTWFHDCFIRRDSISLMDRSVTNFSEIETLVWTFKNKDGGALGVIESQSTEDTIKFRFFNQDDYQIQLEVHNEKGCLDMVNKTISLKPTIPVTSIGYLEDFNGNDTKWRKVSADLVSSWVLGYPEFTGFDTVSGDKAWFTDLPVGDGDYLDRSWIESPCFDLSEISNPVIQMDLMKSFVPRKDGVVLQYSKGTGDGWKTLGFVGEGTNWYNVSGIELLPGGSEFGWGLNQFNPDTEWVSANHILDMLTGNPHVRFRMVIASGAGTELGNQGFAFDNVSISERIRMSVLEHFTNASQVASSDADDVVEDFVKYRAKKVIDLQYHLDYPGVDSMYENNPYPPSNRFGYYHVPTVPYAILNGRSEPEYRFDFSEPSEEPSGEILQQASQEFPPLHIDLDVDWYDNALDVTTTVTCVIEEFNPNVQLYMVVMERLVTAYTGANQDTTFRNVVLDMLPNATGKLLGGQWKHGDKVSKSFHWDYPGYIEDIEDLVVVAFVMDRDNFEIMHAVADYLTPFVGIGQRKERINRLSIYPNPARGLLHVNLGEQATSKGKIQIMDLSGKPVMEVEVEPGYAIYQLDMATLTQGMYIVSWIESGILKGRTKMVRIR